MKTPIYEPLEDSYLIKKYIPKYVKGIVLDMGTGTGILAEEAAKSKKVVKVYAVDINKEAITYCYQLANKKIKFLTSDLFSVFRTDKRYKYLKFDTILFNPPYLPNDKRVKDVALDGGKKGYELICRFINQAEHYIKPNTKIILLFSSLTGKETLDKYLVKKRFTFKEISKQHIFFEDLYVYLIEKD
ncbi:MAG: HemK2/MTQ2 family protein methyltransferase [Nanoarchaeota archaeon]